MVANTGHMEAILEISLMIGTSVSMALYGQIELHIQLCMVIECSSSIMKEYLK